MRRFEKKKSKTINIFWSQPATYNLFLLQLLHIQVSKMTLLNKLVLCTLLSTIGIMNLVVCDETESPPGTLIESTTNSRKG